MRVHVYGQFSTVRHECVNRLVMQTQSRNHERSYYYVLQKIIFYLLCSHTDLIITCTYVLYKYITSEKQLMSVYCLSTERKQPSYSKLYTGGR